MATSKNNTTPVKPQAAPVGVPQGFEERTSDIVGVWDPDKGPIFFVPSHAAVGDGKKFDKTKPSLLIFGKLTADCALKVKARDEDEDGASGTVQGKAGDLVGVWAKPGMKDIATLCGVEVFLTVDPSKDRDTGKGKKMKGYRVASKDEPNTLIPIRSDRRDLSKGTRCFLDAPDYGKTPVNGPVPISGPKL